METAVMAGIVKYICMYTYCNGDGRNMVEYICVYTNGTGDGDGRNMAEYVCPYTHGNVDGDGRNMRNVCLLHFTQIASPP
jgi:hypothetical protein